MRMRIICLVSFILGCIHLSAQGDIELKFNKQGEFKILQFTDIHYVTENPDAQKSIHLMKTAIESEQPDLVVFTGDVVTCSPQKQGWDEVLQEVISHKIPYAVVFGNHDDEHDWSRAQIMSYISQKPLCLAQRGPENIKGVGNYILSVNGNNGKKEAILYFMDSNAYNKNKNDKGYDWFGRDQINWYLQQSNELTTQNQNTPFPALAFFHIPLQEYSILSDSTKYIRVGTKKENECPGLVNSGMFSAFYEAGDVMGMFTGHDHDNDYIGALNNICLAYGRFTGSKTTYTNIGSGWRTIILKEGKRSFDTWVNTDNGETKYKVTYPDSFTAITK